ncbi:MAG: helical backbone metal receptor [Bacteroidota bacterium]
MITSTDQLNRELKLPAPPQRIVSLVPSLTELLFDLGLEQRICGVTSFCVHPKHARKSCTVIGGTKKPKLDRILNLKPDLIVANKEENNQADVETLAKEVPVWVSDIKTLLDNNTAILSLGEVTQTTSIAQNLVTQIEEKQRQLPKRDLKRALYLIWRKPYMSIGGDTFINEMMLQAGYENILADQIRYPELTAAQIIELSTEVILLSSEPYPFRERHIQELQELSPKSIIRLVDGELFSWYGSRVVKALDMFQNS